MKMLSLFNWLRAAVVCAAAGFSFAFPVASAMADGVGAVVTQIPASAYVQDGLVGFWDAQWNQGTDQLYNPYATTWIDLSGQGQAATAGTGTAAVKWGVDRAYMNPSNGVSTLGRMTFTASEAFRSALNSRAWTQQLCLKVRNYMNHDVTFFGSGSGQSFCLRSDYASNHMFEYCGGYYGDLSGKMPSWLAGCTDTLLRDDTRIRRYVDSKLSTDGAAPEGVASVGTEFRLGNVKANEGSCDYELYAVRVYSRELAAIEIAHNDDLDAQRYFGKSAAGNFVQSVSSTGVKYGSPVPSYADPVDVAVGTEYTFSVADSVRTYASDGVLAAKVTDNNRAVYLGGTVRELTDEGLITIAELDNATTSHQVTLASDTDVIWKWKLQYAMQASAADPSMGSVQIADRAAAGSDELWFDASTGGTVTVKAIPGDGMKFDCWVGDLPGTLLNEPEIELTMDQGRTVKASFIEAHHEPVTLTWKNTSGAKWNDVASWREGTVPQDGDTVIITPNGTQSIVLDVATPHLAKLVVSNLHASQVVTIKPDNWFCKIWADEIVFGRGVKLTTDKAFADTSMSNRVWIVANDLTMHKTTEINLDNRGWVDKSSPWYGRTDRAGGGHGGRGGPGYTHGCNAIHLGGGNPKTSAFRYTCEIPGCALYGCAYDSLEAPELPGTSSDKTVSTDRAGGGAVRIDVANHAQVEGKICVRGYGSANGSYGGAAGGSVWISARTVDGAAYIDAGQTAMPGTSGGGGGGGRVSITYDPAAQAAAGYVPQFEFRLGGEVGRPIAYARDPNSNPYYPGEEGTLYLSDMSFYPRAVLRGGGRVYFGQRSSDTLSFPDGLVITNSSVGFPQFRKIDVAGDLKIGGCGALICSDTELTVSGDVKIDSAFGYKTAGAYNTQCCGLELLGLSKLSVGGDFGIDNFGVLYTVAAPTNETTGVFTADLAVAGDFTMTANAWFIPQSHPTNAQHGATRLTARNIRVDQGAMIDGRGRGFQNVSGILKSFGPGAAPASGRGASHAGWGGVGYGGSCDNNKPWLPTAAGAPYGNPKFPLTPGSAAGYPSGNHFGSFGGGQIYLEARRTVTVDGTVSVAGATKTGSNNERGAGSGGSICIKTARLAGSGALIADGGSNGNATYNHGWGAGGGGGGGGGYICVLTESPIERHFSGTLSAVGGNAYTEGELLSPTNRYSVWDHRGFNGKVYTHSHQGLQLILR